MPASRAAAPEFSRRRRIWRGFVRPWLFPPCSYCLLVAIFYLCRRLLRGVAVGEQVDQRALDRDLAGWRGDLGAEQVGDVEHVAGALAEGGDMRRGDVEVELRDRGGELVQQ